jgi:alpha-N-acetylglucosaminidase
MDVWITNYLASRYGIVNEHLLIAWQLLLESSYNSFTDHPRFSWQAEPGSTHSSVNESPKVIEAAQNFLVAGTLLKDNPLYRNDAIELTAMAAGIRADQWMIQATNAYMAHDLVGGKNTADHVFELLGDLDRLLASHPNLQLQNWVGLARANGETALEKDHYEEDAKLLITLWGPNGEIDDYSCRMWSGLIGTYYIPRWRMYFENFAAGGHSDIRTWEKQWVKTPIVRTPQPFADPLEEAKAILTEIQDKRSN